MAKIRMDEKLVRAARTLRYVTLAAILLVLAAGAGAAAILIGLSGAAAQGVRIDAGGLSGTAAAAALVVPCCLLAIALLHLTAMLKTIEQGTPFAGGTRLRSFALYLFLAVLAGVLLPPLLLLAGGTKPAALTLSSGEALMLLVTGLQFLVSRLLIEAQRVADEHGQIV
jgi:hypothetical protein